MFTQIITNKVKEGHFEAYAAASKAFMEDVAAAPGNLEASVYGDKDQNIVNIVRWEKQGDEAVVMTGGILMKHVDALAPHIDGNTTVELWSVD